MYKITETLVSIVILHVHAIRCVDFRADMLWLMLLQALTKLCKTSKK